MKLEIHVHNYFHESESLTLIKEIHVDVKRTKELVMALSVEMQDFVNAATAAFSSSADSLANISADIQRLLASSTGLSPEDKQALLDQTTKLNDLSASLAAQAAVVPEP